MRGAEQATPSSTGLIDRYLDHLGLERRYSPNTVQAARRDLALLGPECETARPADLKSVLIKQHAKGKSASSLARMASSWRGFYAYLVHQDIRSDNPSLGLKTPKKPKLLPKAVGVDQLAGLLSGPLPERFDMAQAHMLIELLYSTGLRISEALSLYLPVMGQNSMDIRAGRLSLDTSEVWVKGKGGKARVVPLHGGVCIRLQDFLQRRRAYLASRTALDPQTVFIGTRSGALSVRSAQKLVAKYANLKGLDQHLHPHMLRHSFGSHLLQATQNLRAVQELLGHASIASTQVYTGLDFTHLSSMYDKAFPRAK